MSIPAEPNPRLLLSSPFETPLTKFHPTFEKHSISPSHARYAHPAHHRPPLTPASTISQLITRRCIAAINLSEER